MQLIFMRDRELTVPDDHLLCLAIEVPETDLAWYAIVALADLPAELSQPLLRHHVVEVPYTGKLYTLNEMRDRAWRADLC
jgi:hypothetical protein